MKKNGYYSSGEFARMAHISVRTVRYYDKLNILKPSYVSDSGARFYTEEDLVRLQQILLLKYLGFSLDDIRMLTVEDTDYHMLRHSLELQLKLVRDKIEQMQNSYGVMFPKGCAAQVKDCAREFISKYGKDRLKEVCKTHFKTYNEV